MKDSKKIKELKHKSRKKSIKEGIFSRVKDSFGLNYISPFAIAINSSNFAVAMLTSINGLLGPLSQLVGSRFIEKNSRKKVVIKSIFWEAIMWFPMAIIAFLFYKGIITNVLPAFLLLFFSVYVISGNLAYPAWFSWMGDVVDKEYRGRWFSKRNLILGFVTIILTISAAFLLDYFKRTQHIMIGFIILFSLALLARLITLGIFKNQYEPKIKLKKNYYFSFLDFLKNAKKNNFGKFTIFRAAMGFATSITGALITIYLLRMLQFTYVTYMIVILSGTLYSILVMELWGKFADKYGNYKTMCITTITIPIVPILWILNTSPIYLILVPSLVSGISWAGFNLSISNYIYDNVTPEKRGLCVSYHNLLYGIGVFFGAGLGAILIKYLTMTFIEPILLIFVIGGIVRMVVVSLFISKLKEVRKTKKIGKNVFKNLILKEGPTTLSEEAHQIMSIGRYLEL